MLTLDVIYAGASGGEDDIWTQVHAVIKPGGPTASRPSAPPRGAPAHAQEPPELKRQPQQQEHSVAHQTALLEVKALTSQLNELQEQASARQRELAQAAETNATLSADLKAALDSNAQLKREAGDLEANFQRRLEELMQDEEVWKHSHKREAEARERREHELLAEVDSLRQRLLEKDGHAAQHLEQQQQHIAKHHERAENMAAALAAAEEQVFSTWSTGYIYVYIHIHIHVHIHVHMHIDVCQVLELTGKVQMLEAERAAATQAAAQVHAQLEAQGAQIRRLLDDQHKQTEAHEHEVT